MSSNAMGGARGMMKVTPLEPYVPTKPPRHIGDLLDCRGRLGLLVPQDDPRYLNFDILPPPRHCFVSPRHRDMVTYLQRICKRREKLNKTYYHDPYGRDMNDGYPFMTTDRKPQEKSEEPKSKKISKKLKKRMELLREAMDEAASVREEQRRTDRNMYGFRELNDARPKFNTQSFNISPHLCEPKSVKRKSEWTSNLLAAQAMSRKKDLLQEKILQLEKETSKGDTYRAKKASLLVDYQNNLMNKIREKEETLDENLKKLDKKFSITQDSPIPYSKKFSRLESNARPEDMLGEDGRSTSPTPRDSAQRRSKSPSIAAQSPEEKRLTYRQAESVEKTISFPLIGDESSEFKF